MKKDVVFFDDMCVLCSGAVRLIHRNDPSGQFLFSAVGSDHFRREVLPRFRESDAPDSIILLRKGHVYTRSAAALRIAVRMRFPWPVTGIFFLVPRFLRDPVYRLIARKRYRWFGKRDTCFVPDEKLRQRFIDEPGAHVVQ